MTREQYLELQKQQAQAAFDALTVIEVHLEGRGQAQGYGSPPRSDAHVLDQIERSVRSYLKKRADLEAAIRPYFAERGLDPDA